VTNLGLTKAWVGRRSWAVGRPCRSFPRSLTFEHMSASPDILSRITTDPHICHGKAVVRGMRWPVQNVLELMASGMSALRRSCTTIPNWNPTIFLACLAFAAKVTEVKSIHRAAQ
jgi:uncharacterized protein (DUF433 family)